MSNPTQPNQLEVWLQGFPREEAEARLRQLEAEITNLREAIALHDRFVKPSSANGSPPPTEGAWTPPNRPEAIRQVLRNRQNAPTPPGVIKDTMIENGWLKDEPAALKKFYSAISTMYKRGHLLRLQDGRYMLPQNQVWE